MSSSVTERLDVAERMLRLLEEEIAQIRGLVTESPAREPVGNSLLQTPPAPALDPWAAFEPEAEADSAWPTPESLPPREPRFRMPEVNVSDLFGARALAWVGGAVTLLGIVFFFALAVNRGWVGATARISLGAIASALLLGAGVWLRRAYGETHSALAAVGAGIAGGYATLAFAAVRYDLVPDGAALALAAGIAALAVGLALRWKSELVAGLGLVGAILAPVVLAVDAGLTTSGVAFVEILLIATALVAVSRRWPALLVVATTAAVLQIAAAVAFGDTDWKLVLAAAVGVATLLGTGLAWQLRFDREQLDGFASGFVLAGAAGALLAAPALFEGGHDRGFALVATAALYGVLATGFLRRFRDLGSLLAAIALAVAGVASATLLSDQSLAMTWAGEAAVLAWLARRIREARFQIGSLAYLALAAAHAITIDTPPRLLFVEVADPARGALTPLVVAAAALFVAALWHSAAGKYGRAERLFGIGDAASRPVIAWAGGLFALLSASLGVLALAEPFDRAHVALDGLWVTLALGLLMAGLLRRSLNAQTAGLLALAFTAGKIVAFDLAWLDTGTWRYGFLIAGGGLLAAGFLFQVLRDDLEDLSPVAAGGLLGSLALGIPGIVALVGRAWHGVDLQGVSLLGLAALLVVLAAGVFRSPRLRDLSTLHWAAGLALAVPALSELTSGTPLVLVWSGVAAVIAMVSGPLRERRLLGGSLAYLAAALAHVLFVDASPDYLFVSSAHPAAGFGAIVLVLAAGAALAGSVPRELLARFRPAALWAGAMLATYGVSLAILELFQAIGSASVDTGFQRGHTAVSAFWGALGLALVYLGLTRRNGLRVAGLGLFGVSLAKLFLYDLAFLSSVARALSFLAVGALLLLAGFFYQRLSSVPEPVQ